ncbi:MAG: hypothetical protein RLZZ09_1999 [Pseudomonadota bacterium]
MNDEHLYEQVAEELSQNGPHAGLWAKAFAESDGVESKAKALYLRYRVEQLAKVERDRLKQLAKTEREARLAEEAAILKRDLSNFEREENERKARAKAEGITPIHFVLLGLIALFVTMAIIQGIHG